MLFLSQREKRSEKSDREPFIFYSCPNCVSLNTNQHQGSHNMADLFSFVLKIPVYTHSFIIINEISTVLAKNKFTLEPFWKCKPLKLINKQKKSQMLNVDYL